MANRKKIIRHQRRPTDQTTIDIGLRKQFHRILRLDTTTIKNAQTLSNHRIKLGKLPTYRRMHDLCLNRRSCHTRTNCPDRLVSNNHAGKTRNTHTINHRSQLPDNHSKRLSSLTLRQSLANTKHRPHPCRQNSLALGRHQKIAFTIQGTPFGMPDNDKGATQFSQHGSRNLTRESPCSMLAYVLRAKRQSRTS